MLPGTNIDRNYYCCNIMRSIIIRTCHNNRNNDWIRCCWFDLSKPEPWNSFSLWLPERPQRQMGYPHNNIVQRRRVWNNVHWTAISNIKFCRHQNLFRYYHIHESLSRSMHTDKNMDHNIGDNNPLNQNTTFEMNSKMKNSDIGTTQTTTSTPPIPLPEPTWSVHSLELHKNHPPMDYNELKLLAKRAVIDLNYLHETNKIRIEQLCQDLGNMMHMIQHVTTTINRSIISSCTDNNKKPETFNENDRTSHYEQPLTYQDIYDKPRGVTTAPIRKRINTFRPIDDHSIDTTNPLENTNDDKKVLDNNDNNRSDVMCQENKHVWDHYIKPTKMKNVGGHYYFVVPTKQGKTDNEK
jgi:hypothetical protein